MWWLGGCQLDHLHARQLNMHRLCVDTILRVHHLQAVDDLKAEPASFITGSSKQTCPLPTAQL